MISISLKRMHSVNALRPYCEFRFAFEWDENRDQLSRRARFLRWLSVRPIGFLALLCRLKSVMIIDFQRDETALAPLANLHDLRAIGITDSAISSTTLEYMSSLADLEYLSLAGSSITDSDILILRLNKKLRTLILTDSNVTDDGLVRLRDIFGDCRIIFDKERRERMDLVDPDVR